MQGLGRVDPSFTSLSFIYVYVGFIEMHFIEHIFLYSYLMLLVLVPLTF